ncbi:MAG: sulfur oxidation c-type cytochrome SoxX [Alphaproteobacteria bacterium]
MRTSAVIAMFAFAAGVAAVGSVWGQSEPVTYEIIDGGIPEPLTDQPGDPLRGELIARDAANATCLICHQMPIPEEPDPGNIGPDLAGVGARYTEAELRLRIVDPKVLNPDTVMPGYYSLRGLARVQEQYVGETIYSSQDVEDVIAYLMTLTER